MDFLSTNTSDRPIPSVPHPARHCLSDAEFFAQDESGTTNPSPRVLRDHFFREGRLTEEHALYILDHATELLSSEPNMVEVPGPVTICGDIHGQYYDLMKLLDVGGVLTNNSYLFLGNYVNRGCFGIECLLYLYTLKLWFPHKFTLLRGNHECQQLTEYFTFKRECLHKYSPRVYDTCLASFRALPIAALVDGRFFCVHGGLSPELELLSDIEALNRFVEPGSAGLLCDLLWSDPIAGFGHEGKAVPPGTTFLYNPTRGCSFFFTYAAACQFLKRNGLLGIIRGHEVQEAGYAMLRKTPTKKFPAVTTIFSAPNYLDVYKNHGAILIYTNKNITLRQYNASPHPYWLPNFQNAFTWSLPFLGAKITEILLAMLSICSEEELDSDSAESDDGDPPEGETDADRPSLPRMKRLTDADSSTNKRDRTVKTLRQGRPKDVALRREEMKSKIIGIGRMQRVFQLLREEAESASELVDAKAEEADVLGSLDVQRQIRQSIHTFEHARQFDILNERLPPPLPLPSSAGRPAPSSLAPSMRIPGRDPAEGLDTQFLIKKTLDEMDRGDAIERLADRIAFGAELSLQGVDTASEDDLADFTENMRTDAPHAYEVSLRHVPPTVEQAEFIPLSNTNILMSSTDSSSGRVIRSSPMRRPVRVLPRSRDRSNVFPRGDGSESPSSDDSLASPASSLESLQPPHNDRQPSSVISDLEKSLVKPSAEPIIVRPPGPVFPSTASTSLQDLPPPLWERDKTSGIEPFPGLNPKKSGGNTNSGSPTLQPEDIGISDGHGTAVDVEPGTFFIYMPHDDRPGTPPTSFTTDDLACVQANFGSGGCLMSIHEPVEAVSWIEDNWNSALLTSIRNSSCSGPFAWMLSPTQPALAIFGSHNEAVVVNMVQTLAHSSGFPVVIRSTSDNPALTLLGDEPGLHNIPVDSSSINGSSDSASGGTNDGAQNTSGSTGAGRNGSQNRTSGTGGDGDEGPNRRGPGVGGNGGGGDRSTSRSENDRLSFNQGINFSGGNDGGGGGDDGGPTMVDGKWASPLHRTRVELSLKLNAGHTYAVNIGYTFKFTINRETEIPIDLGDLTRPLSQSEVVALVDLKVETRQRETQVDRSYASIGFISHRKKSIIDREFLPRGFDLPGRVYKHGQQQQIQRGVKAVLGFSQGSPLATAGFSYNRNNDTSLEATDTKAMPNCCVVAEPGETWNEDKKSYSSYNISYWAQAMQLDAKRPEFLPIEVKVGMGINLRPPGSETPLPQISFVNRNQVLVWVSDTTLKSRIRGIVVLMSSYLNNIWIEPKLSIYEQGEVELGAGFSNTARFKTENQEPGTISLSVAQVEKQSATGSRKLRAGVPSFFTKRSQHTSVKDLADIPTHEYLARGWDVHNDEWRKVVWPALDKDFLAPGPEKTPLVWKIQCPWDRDQ